MASSTKSAALLVAFMAAVVAASSTIATKLAVREIPPITLGALRYSIGAICLLGYLLASGAPRRNLTVQLRDLPRLASTGLLTLVIQAVAIATALTHTSASRVAVLFSTSSLWTIVFSAVRKGERTPLTQLIGVAASIAGIAIVTTPMSHTKDGSDELFGSVLVVIAAMGMASGSMIQQKLMARYNLFTVTFYRIGVSALVLLGAALAIEPAELLAVRHASREALLALAYLGVLGGAVMYLLWGFALGRVSATQVLVFMNLQPFMVTAVAVLFLGEVLTLTFVLGGIVIIAGVVLSQLPTRRARPVPLPGRQ